MPVYQNDPKAIDTLHEYGCLFSSIYYFKEKIGFPTSIDELNSLWTTSIQQGFIDSKYVIQSCVGVIGLMGLPLTYRDAHFPPSTPVDTSVYRILCLFRPSNGFHHFVVGIDKMNIEFDPIMPYSLTARAPETIVDSLRLFDIAN